MKKKIVFISDLHIRNVSRFKEYAKAFTETVKEIKKIKPDYIVNGGDTFHQKLTLSPESVYLARIFFTNLGKICPVYSIVGNHDCNMNNLNRMDAISSALKDIPNNIVLKHSDIYKIDEDLNIGLCSILDSPSKWPFDKLDKTKINIAVYHGPLIGAVNDQNFKLENSTLKPSLFKNYDFVFAGDIHSNFAYDKLNKTPRIWSIGNLIQQNFGESDIKGFLLLDIKSKDDFNLEFKQIKNDYNYLTINLIEEDLENNKKTINKELKKLHITKHTNLRIIFHTEKIISEDHKNNIKHFIADKYGIDVAFSEKSIVVNSNEELQDLENKTLNFNNVTVQNKLLENYIKHKDGYKNILNDKEKLFKLNENINESLGNVDSEQDNTDWTIESLAFQNIFCFKENNFIDFNNLKGVIGLYGPNASGKSSIFNIITFVIFGKTLKKTNMLNVLNHDSNSGFIKIILKKGEKKYRITRILNSNKKASAVKAIVNFEDWRNDEWKSLNEETLPLTNKKITDFFGDLNEFLMTSMSTQDNYNIFIDLGNTDRKEIIMRYLGLGIFNKLHEKTTEQIKEVKAVIASIDNFEEDLTELKIYKRKLKDLKLEDASNKKQIKKLIKEIIEHESDKLKTKQKITSIIMPVGGTASCDDGIIRLSRLKSEISTKLSQAVNIAKNLKNEKNIDIKLEQKLKADYKRLNESKISFETELKLLKKEVLNNDNLDIDCDVISCKLLIDHKKKKDVKEQILEIEKHLLELRADMDKIKSKLFNINDLRSKKENIISLKDSLTQTKKKLEEFNENKKLLEKNKETIKKNIVIEKEVELLNNKINTAKIAQSRSETEMRSNKVLKKEYEARIEVVDANLENVSKMKKEYEILDTYRNIINPNALPNTLLHNYLNKFETEVNRILNDSTNLFIKTELIRKKNNKSVDLDIQYKSKSSSKFLPIELASGAEKLFLSIAIRVGLIKLTSLQKTDTLIIDEGFSSLHASNISKLGPYFDTIKDNFKRIILVTHIEQIQDLPDTIINIKKNDKGETHINI